MGDIHQVEPNVHAGVKYIRAIMDRYFAGDSIDALNRTLLAFAAYNAGPARVAGLRRKAAARGLDPNRWSHNVELVAADVIGRETVTYVGNIYKYYVAYSLVMEQAAEREAALKRPRNEAQIRDVESPGARLARARRRRHPARFPGLAVRPPRPARPRGHPRRPRPDRVRRGPHRGQHLPGPVRRSSSSGTASRTNSRRFAALDSTLESVGIGDGIRVVITGDPLAAARLFFTLDYLGHGGQASLLDGGTPAWVAAGFPVAGEVVPAIRGTLTPRPRPEILADAAWVRAHLGDSTVALLDARPAADYAGTSGSAAPSGHIPGARNIFWKTTMGGTPPVLLDSTALVGDVPRGRRRSWGCGGDVLQDGGAGELPVLRGALPGVQGADVRRLVRGMEPAGGGADRAGGGGVAGAGLEPKAEAQRKGPGVTRA